jgi:hypothetical protein
MMFSEKVSAGGPQVRGEQVTGMEHIGFGMKEKVLVEQPMNRRAVVMTSSEKVSTDCSK